MYVNDRKNAGASSSRRLENSSDCCHTAPVVERPISTDRIKPTAYRTLVHTTPDAGMNTLTLIINAGRSGSTFLANLLTQNYSQERYVAHEDIPVQISKPRFYNRAYTSVRREEVLADKALTHFFDKWKYELESRSVIETGWTAYHLCPVLSHVFKNCFRYVILHRDPVTFAYSRANMGNYHDNTFYDDAHEVSPFDKHSIAPQYKGLWESMNHFEKCMFWWYVVYMEACEFRKIHPEVPSLEIKADSLFSFACLPELLNFLGLREGRCQRYDVPRNEVAKFMKESFPIRDEWKAFQRHTEILKFANSMGYSLTYEEIQRQATKYTLPDGVGPKVRHSLNYWKVKARISRLLFQSRHDPTRMKRASHK